MTYLLLATPLLITLACVALVLTASHWLLLARHPEMGNGRKFPRQLIMLGLTLAGVVAIALALPVSESTRNQVIALVGVLFSGVLAFSSSSVIANMMAGIVLRMMRSFHTGDFVSVGKYFGRVAERGIFDVEIQTDQRELVTLSNAYLIANPITVVRSSGAIVSGTLSLGYDVHHSKVESLMLQAAQETGLQEGFVQILELGNFAITYRVSGLLVDVNSMLTARSNLNRQLLDVLHGAGIEIMSPSFMSQRPIPPDVSILPEPARSAEPVVRSKAENIVFDKAEEAGRMTQQRHQLSEKIADLQAEQEEATGDTKAQLKEALARTKDELAELKVAPVGAESVRGR